MEITKIKPAFEDDRGSIWDFLTDENVHHIGFLISKKGAIRGKHYHKEQKQYTLVLNGKIKVTVKNLQNDNSVMETTELGKMDMVFFPPYLYQEALTDFMQRGHFTRHIRKMRALYKERRTALVDSIRATFGSEIEQPPPTLP